MKELEKLKIELKQIEDNIKRVEKFKKDYDSSKNDYHPYSSRVVGELKHRLIALKQTITEVTKISTFDVLN